MKNFKKAIALIFTLIMGLSVLTGCGSDPVADELEKFLNTDMVEVNANYEDLKVEMDRWTTEIETAEDMTSSINDVILPNLNDSLDKLSKIELTTDEVKDVKAKYQKMLETYKKAFEDILAAIEADDAEALTASTKTIETGLTYLNEYNAALEALAEEKGMTIEY